LHLPADDTEALAHADQAEALLPTPNRGRRRVEALAIVAYVTADRTGRPLKSNPDGCRLSVLDHVVKRFFGNVVQGRFNAPRQSLLRHRIDAYLQLGTLCEALGQVPQGRNQP